MGVQYIKFYTSVNKWGDPNANLAGRMHVGRFVTIPDRIYFCWRMHGLKQPCTHYTAVAALLWFKFDNVLLFRCALKCSESPDFCEIWGVHKKWTTGLRSQHQKDLGEGSFLGKSILNFTWTVVFLECYQYIQSLIPLLFLYNTEPHSTSILPLQHPP